ncbi:MAG: hypothetical protein R2814_15365 [Flavobacteriaceae bacterium]
MTKFYSVRFSSISDPNPKEGIEENQAPLPTGQAGFRAWGKTDFPENFVMTILSCTATLRASCYVGKSRY